MNIFVTSPSPWESARVLPDKHIVKMPLETCQMLAIVCSDKWGHNFGTLPRADGTPYATEKGAFRNHPCTIWANEFVSNWQWLLAHGLAMCDEYTARYGKFHKQDGLPMVYEAQLQYCIFQEKDQTEFVQAITNTDLHRDDPVEAYREYYIQEKAHFAKWRSGLVPEWFSNAA